MVEVGSHRRHALVVSLVVIACSEASGPGIERPACTDGSTSSSGTQDSTSTGPQDEGSTTLGPETSGGQDEPPSCDASTCSTVCTQLEFSDVDPSCSCVQEVRPEEGYLDCPGPSLCGIYDRDYLCNLQALRYGVRGTVSWSTLVPDVGGRLVTYEIIGPGRAQLRDSSFEERACCDESSLNTLTSYFPFDLPPVDDPVWDDCIAELAAVDEARGEESIYTPTCMEPTTMVRNCGGEALAECPPAQPIGDAPCEESCPMASDGVCDEVKGTGLCRDGCDPVDCACEADMPDVCDDARVGGPCPLGSDPDCGPPNDQ